MTGDSKTYSDLPGSRDIGTWSALKGKSRVTVSPLGIANGVGLNGGADFGPDTPNTATSGIQESLQVGQPVTISGTYPALGAPIKIPNYADILFDQAYFNMGTSDLFRATSTSVIRLRGSLTGYGNGTQAYLISASGANYLTSYADITVSGWASGYPALNSYHGTDVAFLGRHLSLSDTALINTFGTNNVRFANAYCHYTSDPGAAPINIGTNDANYAGVDVHDIYVDGGGVLTGSCVVLGANSGYTASGVRFSNITGLNTTGTPGGDCLDVLRCAGVAGSNLYANGTNNGLSLVASDAAITGVTAVSCNAPGIQVGDALVSGTIANVAISGFSCVDCGLNQTGGSASGVLLFAPSGTTLDGVSLSNGVTNYTQNKTLYGVALGTGGTFTGPISINNVQMAGHTGPLSYSTSIPAGAVSITQCPGLNPLGLIADPFATGVIGLGGTSAGPAASTTYTVSGLPVIVTASGGAGLSIAVKDNLGNAIISGASSLAGLAPIPVGYTINFGAFSGSPTFAVYGT
jgi:hypothetical protein